MADALVFDRLAKTLKQELELLNARDPQEQHVLRVVQGVQQLIAGADARTQRYTDELVEIYKRTSDATIHNFRTARADMKFLLNTAQQDNLDPESRELLKNLSKRFSGDIRGRSNPLSRGISALRSSWENTDLVSILSGAATNSPMTMFATKWFGEMRAQRRDQMLAARRDSVQSRLNLIQGLNKPELDNDNEIPTLPTPETDGFGDDRVVPELVKQTTLAQQTVDILRDDNTRDTEIARRSEDDRQDSLLQWERLFQKPTEQQPVVVPAQEKKEPGFLDSLLSRLSFFGVSLSGLLKPLAWLKGGLGTLATSSLPLLIRGIAGIPSMIAVAAAGAVGYAAGTALRNLKPFGAENPSIGEWSDMLITYWKAHSWGGSGASWEDVKTAIMSRRETPAASSSPSSSAAPSSAPSRAPVAPAMMPSHTAAPPALEPLPSRPIVPGFPQAMSPATTMTPILSGSVTRAPQDPNRFAELGRYTSQQESGGGNISNQLGAVGNDSTGGASYGAWQIETNRGTMRRFLQFANVMNPDIGQRLADAGGEQAARRQDPTFVRTWKELAMRQPDAFFRLQRDFIYQNHYTPALQGIKDATGVDISQKSQAIQELLFSTAVQFGPGRAGGTVGAVPIFEKVLKTNPGSDDELVRGVIAEKSRRVANMRPQERAGVLARYQREEADMTGELPVLPSRPIVSTQPARLPMAMNLAAASQEAALASRGGGSAGGGNVTVTAPTVQTVNQMSQSTVVMPIVPRNRESTLSRLHYSSPFAD